MQVSVLSPSPRLAPLVERFTIVETGGEPATRVLLPELGLIVGVRYAGAATQLGDRTLRTPNVAITGVQSEARTMHTHARSGIVLALLRPGAASAWFAAPLHELHGHTLALDELVPRAEIARLGERVAAARDHAARVAVFEDFLWSRVRAAPDPRALVAVRSIETARGSLRVDELARSLDLSQDAFEKRFRRAVGASPKQLAKLVRVRHAIELGKRGTSWTRVAHQAGYFDQSHFIRDFRAITGQAPARFFRGEEYC